MDAHWPTLNGQTVKVPIRALSPTGETTGEATPVDSESDANRNAPALRDRHGQRRTARRRPTSCMGLLSILSGGRPEGRKASAIGEPGRRSRPDESRSRAADLTQW